MALLDLGEVYRVSTIFKIVITIMNNIKCFLNIFVLGLICEKRALQDKYF